MKAFGKMYVAYPKETLLLAKARGRDMTWLVCLCRNEEAWEPVMFSPWESPLERIEGGEACGEPFDTKVFLLPDLDGNGSNELFVWTTTSRIYAIRTRWAKDGPSSHEQAVSARRNLTNLLRSVMND